MKTLEQEIYSEEAILELLGITKKQLDYLRLEKDFPTVYLGKRVRVYLADQVLEYVKKDAPQAQTEAD